MPLYCHYYTKFNCFFIMINKPISNWDMKATWTMIAFLLPVL